MTTHSTAVLFAHFGAWLLGLASDDKAARQERSPVPVQFQEKCERFSVRNCFKTKSWSDTGSEAPWSSHCDQYCQAQ